jgi:hypothetical protein
LWPAGLELDLRLVKAAKQAIPGANDLHHVGVQPSLVEHPVAADDEKTDARRNSLM